MISAKDIEIMREQAVIDRLRDAYVEVKLLRNSLTWRVDYRDVLKWKKVLAKWQEPNVMVDTRNGETL